MEKKDNSNEITSNPQETEEPEKDTTLFQCVDKSVLTLFNEVVVETYQRFGIKFS